MAKRIKKSNSNLPLITLEKGILLQVAGEEEKNHTISWDILKKIGDNTQALISKLARYSLTDNPLDEDALKLQFTGFYPGSAVPAFDVKKPDNNLFDKTESYKKLDADFSFVLGHLGDGNFQAIADRYTDNSVKNEIIDAVTEFSNSAGTRPFSVVSRINSRNGTVKFKQIVKLRAITPTHKALLKSSTQATPAAGKVEQDQAIEAVSKILIRKKASGKTTKKIQHLYSQKEAALSLKFDTIETDKRIYILKYETGFNIVDETKTSVSIELPVLDIYASGSNMDDAQKDLFDQFDFTFQRLNEISNDKLSGHLKDAKTFINMIVDKVKEK